jgi:hypothetical protein
MSYRIFLPLYFLAIYAGFLLPVPSVILAWREWMKREESSPTKTWRRITSLMALFVCTIGAALSIYTMVVEWSSELNGAGHLPSSLWPISVGSWGSFPAIAISALAEGKLRKYLLVTAVGLFCFFNWTMGKAI